MGYEVRVRHVALIGILFFLSGFTGLVYEIVWVKYLALLLGTTAYAQVGVLAVFMGGLALGSTFFGRRADRNVHPLRLYGWLEIGVGLSAALFALGFDALARIYWSALAAVGNDGSVAIALRALLCLKSMLVPTICMGGTLPVLSRALGLQRASVGRGVAYLYAVNSCGAALGSVLAGFVLLPGWGLEVPLFGAALINIVIGLVTLYLDRPLELDESAMGTPGSVAATASQEPNVVVGYSWLVPTCAAISGAVAMIYEVAWIRLCSLVLGSSTYSFCIMLTAFIIGIAAGGLVYTLLRPADERPLRFFALTSLASVAVLLVCLPFYDRLPFVAARLTWFLRQRDVSFALYQASMLCLCVAVMLPLTFISGLNFPALAHAAAASRTGVGRPVGYVLFANTSGTIAGALAGGLYLLPEIGLRATFEIGCALSAVAAMTVFACDASVPRPLVAALLLIGAVLGVGYGRLASPWDLRLLTLGEFRQHEGVETRSFSDYSAEQQQELLYYRDGASATVSVERRPDDLVLRINGKADASAHGDRDTQLLLGHLPAVLHPKARRGLVIGYGSGMTTGALLHHPMDSVDVVEISPEVVESDDLFQSFNGNPLGDPRTHLFIEDARTFLYRTPHKYDVIVSEPSNPWIAGIANLFTSDFFEQIKTRLADDGVLVQWFHTYESSDSVVSLILRTVAASFPEVRVFQPNVWDVIVVASPSALHTETEAMKKAFAEANDLSEVGIARLPTLLATEILSPSLTRALVKGGPLNRDRLPLLEYAAPRAFFAGRTTTLLANFPTLDAGDYLLNPVQLHIDDLRAWFDYANRNEMLGFTSSLRFLAEWLRRDPRAPDVHNAISRWSNERPLSALLMPALMQNPPGDPQSRSEYLEGLLQVLGGLIPRPTVEQVARVEPLARAAANAGDGSPLQRIGELYVAAAGYAEAITVFDALDRNGSVVDEAKAGLLCWRGEALRGLGRKAEALTALRACAAAGYPRLRAQAEEGTRLLSGN